jgi:hypothetical protein
MHLPQPTHAKYSGLINDIERGQIKIPADSCEAARL